MKFLAAALLALCYADLQAAEPILRPPGFRPRGPGVEAITAANVYTDPTTKLSPGTIVIRNGLIEAGGANGTIPAGARVWTVTGSAARTPCSCPFGDGG